MNLAVIGMGSRASHMARLMCELDADVRVDAVVDAQPEDSLRQFMAKRRVQDVDRIRIFRDVEALLDRADDFAGVIIATPCHLHASIAVEVARTRLPEFLEKPVAITWEQLDSLRQAYAGREQSVVVSFPLRLTIHVQTATRIIRSGRLGAINQVQAVNNVPYGGVYFGQWYRDYDKTGGLWLQKATHDFDYITHLLDSAPIAITAMHSRLAYGGDMPADLVCSRCDLTETCPESPKNLTLRGDDGGTMNLVKPSPDIDHACTFSDSILHQDAGSAIIMYEKGVHASYAQNFISRRSAGVRGATVIGYDATLSFSWQSQVLRIIDHHREQIDEIPVTASGGHGGGDRELAANFIDVMRGRAPSRCPLDAGLLSAAMCLCAREAANDGVTRRIPKFGGNAAPDQPRRRGAREIEPVNRSPS
jgi:predicted dehydrogenase